MLRLASASVLALLSSAALAADLPTMSPPPAPMLSTTPIAYNWSGFYIGAHGGWGFGDGDFDEGFVIVTRAAKQKLLESSRVFAQMAGQLGVPELSQATLEELPAETILAAQGAVTAAGPGARTGRRDAEALTALLSSGVTLPWAPW